MDLVIIIVVAIVAVVGYITWRRKNVDKANAFETKVTNEVSELEQKAKDTINKAKK